MRVCSRASPVGPGPPLQAILTSSPAAATVKVSRAPRPGPSLSARIRPPCASTRPLADGEPQSAPRVTAFTGEARALLEQAGQRLGRHAPPLVGDRDRDVRLLAGRRYPDGRGFRRVPRRVQDEVVQDLHDAPAVRHHAGQVRRQVDENGVPPAAAQERVPRAVHEPRPTRTTPARPTACPRRCAPRRAGCRSGPACDRPVR